MRLNTKKKRLETRYLILIILLIIIVLVGITSFIVNDDRKLLPVESAPKNALIFIQRIIYSPFRYIGEVLDERKEMKRIYQKYKDDDELENKSQIILTENEELKREIKALKEQLELNASLTEYKPINATVLLRNVGQWYNTLTIDKGSKHGIKDDMAVIVKGGLIGRTIKTTRYTSEVKLISTNDLNSKISVGIVIDDSSIVYGLVAGFDYKTHLLLVQGITKDLSISKGNEVITSGMSNIFPKGIIVGSVEKIEDGEFGLSKTIKVKPSANLNDIRFVTVLKRED